MVITRFAPSPTGYLHIGGARTALFNYLFTKHHGGQFHLRIEDTDRERSTQGAINAIIDGLDWLQLHHDGEIIYQFSRMMRHSEIAHELVRKGRAYYCYASTQELEEFRQKQDANKSFAKYESPWRDASNVKIPDNIKPVVRLKMPKTGEFTINDKVQGKITVQNKELDDMVLLRADGTPTYMLSVVVDDHDMNISHIIRGSDHLTNAFRQSALYHAMDWQLPEFAHIPLIHGPDGAKLSKRHGALGVDAYRDMGYLPEAVNNYILRLGWGHGDNEIISRDQAIAWFDLDAVGKAASCFDFTKLENLNGHYIASADNQYLCAEILKIKPNLPQNLLLNAMNALKSRAKTLNQLAENAKFLGDAPKFPLEDAKLQTTLNREFLTIAMEILAIAPDWHHDKLYEFFKEQCQTRQVNLGKIANGARVALSGMAASPGFFELCEIFGKDITQKRLNQALNSAI